MLLEDLEKTVISYFDYKIIALYKAESEKYIVKSDFFQGRVCSNPEYIQSPEFEDNNYIDIRFGYRTLKDGSLAVAAWLPDLFEKSKTHVKMWSGLHLENPEWTSDHDERFKSWTKRNLEGSWEVENGPFYQIQEVVENINAITFEYVGYKLFKFELENSISFPSAENDHRYEDSHKELYGYLIDGINKDCISEIAKRSRIEIRIASKNTINSLQSLFPNLEYSKFFNKAMNLVSEKRRNASHGVRSSSKKFPAFQEFTNDLFLCLNATKELLSEIENIAKMKSESALKRYNAKSRLLKFSSTNKIESHYSINQIRKIQGKTVAKVEYGFREEIEGVHQSELIIFYFTDGSIISIDTGSNAGNLASDYENLKPEDFHTDFIISWVPPITENK